MSPRSQTNQTRKYQNVHNYTHNLVHNTYRAEHINTERNFTIDNNIWKGKRSLTKFTSGLPLSSAPTHSNSITLQNHKKKKNVFLFMILNSISFG